MQQVKFRNSRNVVTASNPSTQKRRHVFLTMRNVGEYVEARTRGGIKESMRERGEIRLDEKRINRYPWRVTTIPRWRFHQTIDQNFHTEGNDFSRGNENPGSTVCHRVEVWNASFQEEGLLFRSTFKHRFKPSQAQRLLIRSLRQVSRQRVPPSSRNLSSLSFFPCLLYRRND